MFGQRASVIGRPLKKQLQGLQMPGPPHAARDHLSVIRVMPCARKIGAEDLSPPLLELLVTAHPTHNPHPLSRHSADRPPATLPQIRYPPDVSMNVADLRYSPPRSQILIGVIMVRLPELHPCARSRDAKGCDFVPGFASDAFRARHKSPPHGYLHAEKQSARSTRTTQGRTVRNDQSKAPGTHTVAIYRCPHQNTFRPRRTVATRIDGLAKEATLTE